MLDKELSLEFFKKNGYVRKRCKKCGKYFWTLKRDLEVCMDSPCVEYQFIGNPITKKKFDLREMREAFLSFFEKHGHKRLKRYPVVARWRNDIYFTIASIADFQPHVTSGEADPPANPLVISQPCIRFTDIDAVGKSGRHLTNFEMMAHHAFNTRDKYIYWKEETVEYALRFFTEVLGIPKEEIVFKENPWFGGGNAGAAFEVVCKGLELATLVFMNLKEDPNGEIEIAGTRYSPMDLNIVDTGYGLERIVWFTKGDPTIYDAIYPDIVEFILEKSEHMIDREDAKTKVVLSELSKTAALIDVDYLENLDDVYKLVLKSVEENQGIKVSLDEVRKIAETMSKVYAVADHTRALVFMLGDGVVPSNMKEGYFARMLIRRSVRMLYDLGIDPECLWEIMERHLENMKEDYPEIYANRDIMKRIIEIEVEKYLNTLERGRAIVIRMLRSKGTISAEDLVELYDSHGLTPEIVREIAKEHGVEITVPSRFYSLIADRHSRPTVEEVKVETVSVPKEIPETKLLYYDLGEYVKEFDAVVLWSNGKHVILDQTAFYPTGGGQEHDTGIFITESGERIRVKSVFKVGKHVIHEVEKEILPGTRVHGVIDWERRRQLMIHHTATHVILAAARRVLGPHVWQAGAEKTVDRVRFDITHFERPTDDEIMKIEEEANRIVWGAYKVTKKWIPRKLAEEKYGFRLYQGGVPPGAEIRVIVIGDEDNPVDAQACGGTHVNNTSEIGFIKILSIDRIQDGVIRLEFAAGPAALKHVQRYHNVLKKIAVRLNTKMEGVENAVSKVIEDNLRLRKEVESLKKKIAEIEAVSPWEKIGEYEGFDVLYKYVEGTFEDAMETIKRALKEQENAILIVCNPTGQFAMGRREEVTADLTKIAKILKDRGIKCGGKEDFIRGKADSCDDLVKTLKEILKLQ
ncbi:MAG: alanine--tRNA ligase [Euryarchaeota archaeon]|nr:alanine--tRNA ligase [Euryarchaeota archaeon]